jgi:hypothetical protein
MRETTGFRVLLCSVLIALLVKIIQFDARICYRIYHSSLQPCRPLPPPLCRCHALSPPPCPQPRHLSSSAVATPRPSTTAAPLLQGCCGQPACPGRAGTFSEEGEASSKACASLSKFKKGNGWHKVESRHDCRRCLLQSRAPHRRFPEKLQGKCFDCLSAYHRVVACHRLVCCFHCFDPGHCTYVCPRQPSRWLRLHPLGLAWRWIPTSTI